MNRKWVLLGSVLMLLLGALSSVTPVKLTPVQAQGGPQIPPAPANGWFVLDQLGWFNQAQLDKANGIAKGLKDAGLAEIGVALLNDCGPKADRGIFRTDVFNAWGIGDKQKNNGLLILICWQGGDSTRTIEQAVGRGLEGLIPDLLTNRVRDEIFVPVFKGKDAAQVVSSGQAADGVIAMMAFYDNLLRNPNQAPPQAGPQPVGSIIGWMPNWVFWLLVILVLCLIVGILWLGSNGSSGSWGGGSSGSSGGSFFGGGGGGGDSGGGGFSGGTSGGGGSGGSF